MTTTNSKRSTFRPFRIFLAILLLLVTTLPVIHFHRLEKGSINLNGGFIATHIGSDPLPPIHVQSSSKSSSFTPGDPRFVLGIMSHDQYKQEIDRRATIRSTYLSFFSKYEASISPNRICALKDLILEANNSNNDSVRMMDDSKILWNQCQLAYTFVVGGATTVDNNPSWNRTELLEPTVSSELLTRTLHSESDVISLNIQENGKFGKSPTWFRYATLLLKEFSEKHDQQQDDGSENNFLPFDYIIKTDSDTLIIPKRFFKWVEEQEQRKGLKNQTSTVVDSDTPQTLESLSLKSQVVRQAIYGGSAFDKQMCGFPSHEHCALLQTPVFMGGALYFVSIDLADYISSHRCPRTELFIPHEDMTMGNYVHSYEAYSLQQEYVTPRKVVRMSYPKAYLSIWIHPVKNPKHMKGKWRKYIAQYKKRKRTTKEARTIQGR
ncbi:unnamed protein product [Cylindrotheca closterium]|uniref:Hexosyltransferase n=1 Tax=Cylindrotheca closterium TaxID=2856 RepID=A0AAD2JJK0_9STRA|nr:unnamed protein product [Cylindrotheca closterium]